MNSELKQKTKSYNKMYMLFILIVFLCICVCCGSVVLLNICCAREYPVSLNYAVGV
jgi:hypothetical protein